MEIEVFGATGEFLTGKTILGLSIAPGVHPEGHAFAGKSRTLYLDLEKSGKTYNGTGCNRIDVPATLAAAYGPNYTAKQAAEWFNALPAKLQPDQFDVIMVDPVNDIEAGEVDVVRANPAAHGYTKGQFDNSAALLMAAMKAHWKRLLMQYSNVCKCFYFTTHLRDEFKGGKPSGKREPRGKETLAELASLYLWLEQPDGQEAARPSAIVLKHRLADIRIGPTGDLEIVRLMPERIPVATVQAIRAYIANPPDFKKPAAGEKVVEKPVTEVELQLLRLHTAEAQTAAAAAQTNVLERQRELVAIRQSAPAPAAGPVATATTAKPTAPAKDAGPSQAEIDAAREKAEAGVAAMRAEEQRLLATQPAEDKAAGTVDAAIVDRVARFKTLAPLCGIAVEKILAAIAKMQPGAKRFGELSPENQNGLLAAMQARKGRLDSEQWTRDREEDEKRKRGDAIPY